MKLLRKKRVHFAAVTVVLYALLMTFGGCADKLILFPSTGPLPAHTAKGLEVQRGHQAIQVWVDRSPGAATTQPAAYVIEFTGNATRAEQVATYAALRWGNRPVEVWTVNYPGYGQSTGPATLASIPPAALAVYDELQKRASGKPIFAAGNSLGTTAALYLATQRPIAGLILQNPPAIKSLILSNYGWWNLWLLAGPVAANVPTELDSPANAAKVKVPALFLLATDDSFVVPENQNKVVNAHAGPKQIIELTGGHNGSVNGQAEAQFQKQLDWLWAK